MTTILQIATALIIGAIVLRQPYLGIVFTAATLPITDLLPQISGVTSVVPLVGAVTLVGFLWQRSTMRRKLFSHFSEIHFVGLIFLGWLFISNPQAAWFGRDRNWILTFFQLWILLWLAGELLDTPTKHYVFMWVFSIVTIASALMAIRQGGFGEDIDISVRASGLTQGANTAARY